MARCSGTLPVKRGITTSTQQVRAFTGKTPSYSGPIVPTEGLPHPHARPVEVATCNLPKGTDAMRNASMAGCIDMPLELGMEMLPSTDHAFTTHSHQKALSTRAMGLGIRDEMSGFAPRSDWARENILKSLTLALQKR